MKTLISLLAVSALAMTGARAAQPLPALKSVSATDSRILYVGRVAIDSGTAHLSWPGSYLQGRFTGTSLKLILAEPTNDNAIWLKIDQSDWSELHSLKGQTVVDLSPRSLASGNHEFMVVKKTEPTWGGLSKRLSIRAIQHDADGQWLGTPGRSGHIVEFIGDSITAGFAVNGPSSLSNDDPMASYAFQSAQAVGAEPWLMAQSGIGVVRNHPSNQDRGDVEPMPSRYQKLRLADQPDIIVVNLGTNDFFASVDTDTLKTAYLKFLTDLLALHPKSWILALRPFHGYYAQSEQQSVESVRNTHVKFIDTTGWLDFGRYSTDGTHPNLQGHAKVAARLIPILKGYLSQKIPRDEPSSSAKPSK